MKVLVIGAGVGGLTAARALGLAGHQASVFEQATALRTSGAAVTLWSNGTGVLDALAIPLDGLGGPIDVLEQRGPTGTLRLSIDTARSAKTYGHPHLCVPRARLAERLAEHVPADTVEFGRRCARISENDDGVVVEFDDGSKAEGDVLIGADGRNSVVRDHAWGSDPAEPSGWATWQGVNRIACEITESRRGVMYVGKPGMCGLMPAGDGLLQWWFDVRWSPDRPMPQSPVADLRRQFAGWAEPVATVLAAIEDDDAGFFPHVRHRVPETWGVGRISLVGDSAHSMPPTRAQGANQALEDAWCLAEALRSVKNANAAAISDALRAYERTRSPKAGRVAREAGTEDINRHRHLRTRLVPSSLAGWYYEYWLGRVSNFLS